MRRSITIALAFALLAANAARAEGDPEAEVRAVLEQLRQEAGRGPDARQPEAGEIFPTERIDRVLAQSETRATARISWDTKRGEQNGYVYLVNDGGWKVEATRGFALTGLLEELQTELRAAARTPEMEDTLRNLDLTLASDAALASWFTQHRGDLELLAHAQPAELESARCKRLGLGVVERSEGTLRVVIGGVLDNVVGFLFSPNAPPPPIDPSDHIWVEPLGDGWFLYRTT